MSDEELVAIYSARLAGEAEVVRLTLESEGIAACIEEKQFAGLFGLLEFNVLVKLSEKQRANRFLADRPAIGPTDASEDHDTLPAEGEEDSTAEGAETPAILSQLRGRFRAKPVWPPWLRWLME